MKKNCSKKNVILTIDGHEYRVQVGDLSSIPITGIVNGKTYHVQVQGSESWQPKTSRTSEIISHAPRQDQPLTLDDSIIAPMPGDIIEIMVQPGDKVIRGQDLCVLEAMKMKNLIRSPRDGRIKSICVERNQKVAYGDVLLHFE